MSFQLNSTPRASASLPSDKQQIVQTAEALVDGVASSWKKGKCYKHKLTRNPTLDGDEVAVQTYYTTIGSDYWLSRASSHHVTPAVYEAVVRELNGSTRDRAPTSDAIPGPAGSRDPTSWQMPDRAARSRRERDYIEVLSKVDVVDTTAAGWVLVNLEYELGRPMATREFNEWVYPVEPYTATSGRERCMVVSLVADAPLRDPHKHTHGIYASVELLEYDYATSTLYWTMCTTSDAGGNVPKWIQNATIAKTVSKDVSFFLSWLGEQPSQDPAN
ncbi:LAFE_0D09318g1_1 [Lachancea fermentati]|uniref:LAFE_0D09318g1_1 n=1 Tax=Lachancea fermentati TaxID=4955 RepID=A0A1G4MBS4_LACFM|nr:LAFE_0D09318g1_1 [Lachancea fermentati]